MRTDVRRKENRMGENNEERIVMLTIKEAAALVEGLTEYRGVRCA